MYAGSVLGTSSSGLTLPESSHSNVTPAGQHSDSQQVPTLTTAQTNLGIIILCFTTAYTCDKSRVIFAANSYAMAITRVLLGSV